MDPLSDWAHWNCINYEEIISMATYARISTNNFGKKKRESSRKIIGTWDKVWYYNNLYLCTLFRFCIYLFMTRTSLIQFVPSLHTVRNVLVFIKYWSLWHSECVHIGLAILEVRRRLALCFSQLLDHNESKFESTYAVQ